MIAELYATHPFSFAAVLLAAEVATGSGYILWPAGSAAIVALLTGVLPGGFAGELMLFAALTLITSLAGRRFFPRHLHSGPDINDNLGRLVGQEGTAVSVFENGHGRVFIDGKEWPAIAEGEPPMMEQRVHVTAAEGVVLKVRPA